MGNNNNTEANARAEAETAGFDVTVICGTQTRHWQYTKQSTFSSLNKFVASSFNLITFWLHYEDDEGHHLTLSSQKIFEDAFESARKQGRKSLKIYIITSFKMHIAIDFGTDGSGIAIAYKGKVYIYDKWRTKSRGRTVKTKTHILLNKKNNLMSFGANAKFMYSECKAGRKEQKFFERFKMALYADNLEQYHDDEERKDDGIDTKKYLTDANGKELFASIVFEEAFKHLRDLAIKYKFKVTKDDIKNDEIQWILTVPAIWSEAAKDNMRQWMVDAKVINDDIIDQCVIVYEPDCASLAIQKEYFEHVHDDDGYQMTANPTDDNDEEQEMKHNTGKYTRFAAGERYILVDAGGGTVDIASHKILDDGSVEEIEPPSGGDWGSSYIDDLYVRLLEDIFSKEWIDFYKNDDESQFVNITHYFELAKKEFYEKDKQKEAHLVELPFEFVQYLEEKCDDTSIEVEDLVHKYDKSLQYFGKLFEGQSDNKSNTKKKRKSKSKATEPLAFGNDEAMDNDNKCKITLISAEGGKFNDGKEYLEIDTRIWKCIFDSKIDKIIAHVGTLLSKASLENCTYLCLVGGFSASKYLQERMRDVFGSNSKYNLKFVIPTKPILSVVQGAAYFGIHPGYIKARKLKHTYGISVYLSEKAAKSRGIPAAHIESNKTKEGMIKNCFHVIARKGDRIGFNQIIVEKVHKIPGQKSAFIIILRSDKTDPRVATAEQVLGSIAIRFDAEEHNEIVAEFQFYGTMFKVYSYPKANPTDRKAVTIKYRGR